MACLAITSPSVCGTNADEAAQTNSLEEAYVSQTFGGTALYLRFLRPISDGSAIVDRTGPKSIRISLPRTVNLAERAREPWLSYNLDPRSGDIKTVNVVQDLGDLKLNVNVSLAADDLPVVRQQEGRLFSLLFGASAQVDDWRKGLSVLAGSASADADREALVGLAVIDLRRTSEERAVRAKEAERASAAAVSKRRVEADRQRVGKEQEAKRIAAEKAELEVALEQVAQARRKSIWRCASPPDCERAFALAQIFLDRSADMKIQVATNTILETYNPTAPMKMGLKVVRVPLKAGAGELVLTANCNADEDLVRLRCARKELAAYQEFPRFLKTMMSR